MTSKFRKNRIRMSLCHILKAFSAKGSWVSKPWQRKRKLMNFKLPLKKNLGLTKSAVTHTWVNQNKGSMNLKIITSLAVNIPCSLLGNPYFNQRNVVTPWLNGCLKTHWMFLKYSSPFSQWPCWECNTNHIPDQLLPD